MRAVWCGFALGVLCLQQQAVLPGRGGWWALVLVASSLVSVAVWLRSTNRSRLTAVAGWLAVGLASGCVGFDYAALRAEQRLAWALPIAQESRDIVVEGYVKGLPAREAKGARFLFEVESNDAQIERFPRTIQLSWIATGTPPPVLEPGARWRLSVRLKRPHGNANFGLRDAEASLLARNVRGTGYVSAPSSALRLPGTARGLGVTVDRWRAQIRARIEAALGDAPHAGIVVALAVGAQDAVSATDWLLMRNTGTSHLVAISGLHIGFVAGLAAWIVGSLWRRSCFVGRDWPLLIPAQKVATLGGVLFAAGYAALAGFNVPAQRALWMLVVASAAFISGRSVAPSIVLAWAVGLVLLIDPWAVVSAGFWLSFCAVAAILFATSGRLRIRDRDRERQAGDIEASGFARIQAAMRRCRRALSGRLRSGAHVQFAVTLALAPLTVYWFAQIPLVGPLANAFAIPWASLFVTPMVLAGIALPAPLDGVAFRAANALLDVLVAGLQALSGPAWMLWRLPQPDGWALAAAAVGVAWCLAPRGWPLRWAAPLTWLPLLLPPLAVPAPGTFRLTALDIGQGSSILIETAHHSLLFDAGPGPESTHAGERIVLPYLYANGVKRLDALVISHADSDHAGGAPAVLAGIEVRQLLAALEPSHPLWTSARGAGVSTLPCAAGQRWHWDGVDFTVLWPDAGPLKGKPNDHCCVLRVSATGDASGRGQGISDRSAAVVQPGESALLAADIEAPVERILLARDPGALRAQVLIVSHHGSKTSSTEPFLDSVDPLVAIFQVGYRNRFHHPNPGVYARYLARHIELSRSDADGAARIEVAGKALSIERYRDTHRRYWMDM
ncbi:DNA internalization-related competence protein ComEC/Rec2 [Paraburkholderia sp. BL10I2N1]|uniref:DNA internalization-related competence protein ComEC/Rec2 n=1 Tax=Paraburkholderia sp. BL10I2N1 TaxID=1938796 RepID=UPI00105E7572|nr:DNA internalization-related competence protein ComEC/Rec2 [Paraburkholderia sp. BL10I2N1]TDN69577.1 competence protein ComEC [Paraburkholderia sp. BL10I2N1]